MRTYTNIKNVFSRIDAMLNSGGRTQAEAEMARQMAAKLMAKNGLNADNYAEAKRKATIEAAFAEMKRRSEAADADHKAHAKAKDEAKREKAKKAKAKAPKQPKDDGRMRVIKAASSPDAKGKRKWTVMMTVRHSELKAAMAEMRAKGMVVKSEVAK